MHHPHRFRRLIWLGLVGPMLLALGCSPRTPPPHAHVSYAPAERVIPLDGKPTAIAMDGDLLVIGSFYQRRLWQVDKHSGRVLKSFDGFDTYLGTPGRDEAGNTIPAKQERAAVGALAVANDRVFVYQTFEGSLLVLDKTFEHIARIPIAEDQPNNHVAMAVSPDQTELYVAHGSGFVIINTQTLDKTAVSYPDARGAGAVTTSPDGRLLYLGIQRLDNSSGVTPPHPDAGPSIPLISKFGGPVLAVYDLQARSYVARLSLGDTMRSKGEDASWPASFVFSDNGKTLYIPMHQSMAGVHVLDTQSNQLRAPITFASTNRYFHWPGCTDAAVSDGMLYVIVGSNNELHVLDEQTRQGQRITPLGWREGNPIGPMVGDATHLYICNADALRVFVVRK